MAVSKNKCAYALASTLIVAGAMSALLPASAGASASVDVTAAVAYQQDPAHDGLAVDPAFVSPLTTAWSADLPGTVGYPLIANGEVILVAANANRGTSVEARTLATGDLLWGPTTIGASYSFGALAYDDGQVFAINDGGWLTAFDAASGATVWAEQMPGQYQFSSPPTAVDGTIYISGSGSGGTVYAVAESDGSVRWTQSVLNGDDSSPAVDSSGVYVSYACEQAYGFGFDGTPLWHHQTYCEGGGGRTAVLHGGKVYIRDDAGMTAAVLDEATEAGRALWSTATANNVIAPLIANGYVGSCAAKHASRSARTYRTPATRARSTASVRHAHPRTRCAAWRPGGHLHGVDRVRDDRSANPTDLIGHDRPDPTPSGLPAGDRPRRTRHRTLAR